MQGAFIEHIRCLQNSGVNSREVRLPGDLEGLAGLIIPGGESTTILKLIQEYDLYLPIRDLAEKGVGIWGTCAGMICLANTVVNDGIHTLGLMDLCVKRNAFGRQVDSFESDLNVSVFKDGNYHAVFIRAPVIESVGKDVKVLAKLDDGTPVAARQGRFLATSFHPELTEDLRFHRFFIDSICKATR